jgi:hypothetical protein
MKWRTAKWVSENTYREEEKHLREDKKKGAKHITQQQHFLKPTRGLTGG